MGLGKLFRRLRADRHAMPDPGSAEFQEAIAGSALPGSTEMGQDGWVAAAGPEPASIAGEEIPPVSPESLIAAGVPVESAQATAAALTQLQRTLRGGAGSLEDGGTRTIDVRRMEALRDQMEATMREHGVDPRSGRAIEATEVPGLQEALLRVLAENGVDVSQRWRRSPRGPPG